MGRIGLGELLILAFLVAGFVGLAFSSGWGCAMVPGLRTLQLHPAVVGPRTPPGGTSSAGGMAKRGLRPSQTRESWGTGGKLPGGERGRRLNPRQRKLTAM